MSETLIEIEDDHQQNKRVSALTKIEASEDVYFGGTSLDANAKVENDSDIVIKLHNVHKTYLLGLEGVPALRGVSLSIKRGEFVCIFGTSGGGKTSMLNIIGTIDKPTKGDINLCQSRIDYRTPDTELSYLRLENIGFVFQTFNLMPSLTAIENVELPMILAGKLSASERRQRALSLLNSVGIYGERLDHFPSQLSGGEQQRVTIARSISNNPEVLLLDEPTGDLDSENSTLIMQLLLELNQKGMTMVMVTHDISLKYYGNRVIWLRDGKIQRIEIVPSQVRDHSLKQLKALAKQVQKKKQMQRRREGDNSDSEGKSDGELDIEDGMNGSSLEGHHKTPVPTFSNTQIRESVFYPQAVYRNPTIKKK